MDSSGEDHDVEPRNEYEASNRLQGQAAVTTHPAILVHRAGGLKDREVPQMTEARETAACVRPHATGACRT